MKETVPKYPETKWFKWPSARMQTSAHYSIKIHSVLSITSRGYIVSLTPADTSWLSNNSFPLGLRVFVNYMKHIRKNLKCDLSPISVIYISPNAIVQNAPKSFEGSLQRSPDPRWAGIEIWWNPHGDAGSGMGCLRSWNISKQSLIYHVTNLGEWFVKNSTLHHAWSI